MAAPRGNPEVTGAVIKGAIAEGVLIAIGAAIYAFTGTIAWLIGAAGVGAFVIVLLMAQAGAFKRR